MGLPEKCASENVCKCESHNAIKEIPVSKRAGFISIDNYFAKSI